MSDDEEYALLLAFDSDDPEFTRGFEAGKLWAQMQEDPYRIIQVVTYANSEMVMRMAEARGYEFSATTLDENWVTVNLVKA